MESSCDDRWRLSDSLKESVLEIEIGASSSFAQVENSSRDGKLIFDEESDNSESDLKRYIS